jgi:flagellin-like protein
MKGISPLIASVILIAVTLAIAGILSTWAFQFVGRTQTGITTSTECINSLQFTVQPSYSNGILTLSYTNTKDISLENITAIYTLPSGVVNGSSLGTLGPAPSFGSKQITGLPSRPSNLKIYATNCGSSPLQDINFIS